MGKGKKAAAAAVTAAAIAGLVANAVVESPADLLEPQAVTQDIQQAEEQETSAPQKRQRSAAAKLRAWLLGLPAAVRMLVALPLWCFGWVLLTGASTLWAGAATPLVQRLLGWLCMALMLFVVFAVSVKAAFPALPVRRILRSGNMLFLLGMTALLAAADLALPAVWKDYGLVSRTVWRVGAACLLACSCGAVLKQQGKQAQKARQKEAGESGRTYVEQEALRLADTVCKPR